MKILVADDELAIRSLVAELLEDEGHIVTLAEDGEDALKKYREERHEIVFSDIRMPKMTGIELLGKIKKMGELTQFIIMTSHASVDNSIEALKNGEFDYILKQFEDLAAGGEITVSFERAWDASSPAEGEFPPTYTLRISFDPDIFIDGNEQNDDCRTSNNRLERSGSGINDLFTSGTL